MKQRDVYHTSSILITHRLQDAFMLATHYFDKDKNTMVALPTGEADRDTASWCYMGASWSLTDRHMTSSTPTIRS